MNDDNDNKKRGFRIETEQDQVQRMMSKVEEVSRTNVSQARYIAKRILAKDQFIDRQRGFFNLGEGQIEKGLTGTQHSRIFQLASQQAISSFAPEDRALLASVLAGKSGGFTSLSSNQQVDVLEQALKEGKQSKLLVQLVNRTRRSIRPIARHMSTHYGADALEEHRFGSTFPSTLGMSIPLPRGEEKIISTTSLDSGGKSYKKAVQNISQKNSGFAKELENYFEGMRNVDRGKGIHKGFSSKFNRSAVARMGSQEFGQYAIEFSYDNRDITLKLPMVSGNTSQVGYTGANLNVRRMMTPVGVVKTGEAGMGIDIIQRNEFFMRRFNEEVLPLMQEGKISGRELRAYIKELNSEAFNGQQATSGRAFTSQQNFAQRRYERELGAAVQLVTRQTGGLMQGNVPMAYSSLSEADMVKFLNLNSKEYGIDVSENKFAGQGIVARKNIKSNQSVGGSIVGDLTVHEFADPRVTEHARLDQKIRKRTMATESVIASYKGGSVHQREYQEYGNQVLRRKIKDWASRDSWNASSAEISKLQTIASNKRLNFDDLDAIKAIFTQNSGGDFATLSKALNSFAARVDTSSMRLEYNQKFLSPQEQVLYGMSSGSNGFTQLDNKSMLPASERKWEELKRGKRLGAARNLLQSLEKDILKHPDFSAHTQTEKTAWANEVIGKVSKQTVSDAGFLLASSDNLPYIKKANMKSITSMILANTGVEEISSFLPKTADDHVLKAASQLAQREEVLQVGTMYVDPSKMRDNPTKYFGSGEGIMRKSMTHLLSQEMTMNRTMAKLNPDAFELLEGTKINNGEFSAGGFKKNADGSYIINESKLKMRNSIMGWDAQGREIVFDKKMRNIQFSEMDANDGSTNKWLLMEFDELMRPESHVKLHGDIKQGVSFVGDGVKGWKKVANALAQMMVSATGAKQLSYAGSNQRVENITEMQFKHGRRSHQHIRQIATAMSLAMSDLKMNNAMANDPFQFTKKNLALGSNFEGERKAAHTAQVQKMMNWYAEQAKTNAGLLDQDRFSGIFGLTGSVFGDQDAGKMVHSAFKGSGIASSTLKGLISGSKSGAAFGVARQFMGDPMSMQGAGKVGTFEARSIMTMEQKSFGKRGDAISRDFLKRMKSYDLSDEGSEKWAVRDEMKKSMRTIIKQERIPSNAAVIDLTGRVDSVDAIKRMSEQGKNALNTGQEVWLKTGDKKGIYVPAGNIPGMAEKTITTMSGDIKASAVLRNAYNRAITDVAGGLSVNAAIGDLQDELFPHQAEFSKAGMGGVLKGSLPGSRMLVATSASDAGQRMPDANVVGISRKHADRMFTEMIDTGLYDEGQIAKLRMSQFALNEGGTIAGIIARHPFIGSYSVQKTLFKLIDDPGDVIVMPEINVDVNINGKANRFKLGPMLGTAADYDFDTMIAAFLDPDSEKAVAQEMDFKNSSDYYERHIHHQIRYQSMQLKKGATSSQVLNNMEDAAGKMHVKQKYVGRLSNEMTFMKFAASSYIKDKERAAALFGLAEWLEQKPISAKHLNPKELQASMERLVTTFERPMVNAQSVKNMLSEFIDVDSTKDIYLSQSEITKIYAATGYQMKTKPNKDGMVLIKGFNLDELAEDIFNAHVNATRTGLRENLSTMKGTTKGAAAARSFNVLEGAGKTGIGKVASLGDQVAANLLGVAGQSSIVHHRGVQALGVVGSIVGLATVLSEPKEMVGPGKHLDTRVKMNMTKGTKRITQGDIKPPRAPIGAPTGPGMLSQRRAMIAPNPVERNHYVVRARTQYPEDVALISQQLQQFTSMNNSVSISVRDSRGGRNNYFESNKKY
jgi:hypothetical protein